MWIARDKGGLLKIFLIKPMRSHLPNAYFWVNSTLHKRNYIGEIDDNSLFPELKWEDEPIEVELIPVVKESNYIPDIQFPCKICSHNHCISDLQNGREPSCTRYRELFPKD